MGSNRDAQGARPKYIGDGTDQQMVLDQAEATATNISAQAKNNIALNIYRPLLTTPECFENIRAITAPKDNVPKEIAKHGKVGILKITQL